MLSVHTFELTRVDHALAFSIAPTSLLLISRSSETRQDSYFFEIVELGGDWCLIRRLYVCRPGPFDTCQSRTPINVRHEEKRRVPVRNDYFVYSNACAAFFEFSFQWVTA